MSTEIETALEVPMRMAELSREYSEIMTLGRVLHASGYFKDVKDQAQAVTKILFGRELGFSPIVSMSGIYIIEGKPALSANLLAATIKRSGKYDYRITAWDSERCEIMFREKVNGAWQDVGPSSFTKDDATRAEVWGKNTWKKYPKAMLFARALSQGERAYCPDVSSCALYVPEELGATVNESGEVLTVQDLPKSARPVERTTEDIPLKRPDNPTPAEAYKEGWTDAKAAKKEAICEQAGESPAAPLDALADALSRKMEPENFYEKTKAAVATKQAKPDTSAVDEPSFLGCIDTGRKIAFARAWKDAVPKELAKSAERLRGEWLARHGYVDDEGLPTCGKIPLAEFEAVKKDAIVFARGLK